MSLFFELIQVAVGVRAELSRCPSSEEWAALADESRRHTLTGVLFGGIERLPQEQRPSRQLMLQWYARAERIRQMNRRLNDEVARIVSVLDAEGLESVLLKGQGVATYYPVPLLRMPGDVDLWLPVGRKRVLDYVRRLSGWIPPTTFLHTSLPLSDWVETEAHFMPSFRYNPLAHRRMNGLFERLYESGETVDLHLSETTDGRVRVPSPAFNRLYLLAHIYRHFFDEGVGLRQLMDYFFCLQQPFTEEDNLAAVAGVERMGLLRFARAVMYVQQRVFGLDSRYCFVRPDEGEGRFLLDEVMAAGNFGKYDQRRQPAPKPESRFRRFAWKMWRNLRFVAHYPGEALWDVPFRVTHYLWRRINGFL